MYKSIFERFYDAEVNFKISTFWDAGYDLWLGDHMNGYKAEGNVRTWAEVEPWFAQQAAIHYPGILT